MFGFLPIIGPIINGIVSLFTTWTNATVQKYQTDATVATAEIQATSAIAQAFKDDLGIQLTRDLILFGVASNVALISWDNIVVANWPWLYIPIAPYPSSYAYLPLAAMTFLFGINSLNIWKAFR